MPILRTRAPLEPHQHSTLGSPTRSVHPKNSPVFLLLRRFGFAGQGRWVFMRPLPEAAFHAGCKGDARLPEFVPEPVRRGKGLLPFPARVILQEISLRLFLCKRRCLDTQQADLCAFAPVRMKQLS